MHFIVPIVGVLIIFIALTTGGGASSSSDDSDVTMRRSSVLSGIGVDVSPQERDASTSRTTTTRTAASARQTTAVAPAPVVTSLKTLSAQNITERSALLRGELEATDGFKADVFFIYSKTASALQLPTRITSYDDLKAAALANLGIQYVSGYVRSGETMPSRTLSGLTTNASYAYRLCVDSGRGIITCGNTVTFTAAPAKTNTNTTFRAPSVTVGRATAIGAYEATITGSYRVNSGEEITVFVAYGDSKADVSAITTQYDSYEDVRERDEALQKVRVARHPLMNGSVVYTLDELERDTEYFYRLCASYTGRYDGIVCTSVRTFTTDARDLRAPEVTIDQVSLVRGGAILTGSVDMNNYRDGHTFVVYGTELKRVQAVETARGFTSIRQDRDRIQRISLDTDVDGIDTITATLKNLTPTTGFFARFCVEYKTQSDTNPNTTVTTVECSEVRPFVAI